MTSEESTHTTNFPRTQPENPTRPGDNTTYRQSADLQPRP
mgnify:FL=1